METVATREASLNDIDTLISLGRQTFSETYKGMGERNRPQGLEETYGQEVFNREKLLPQLKANNKQKIILGFVGSQPAGFMKLEKSETPSCLVNKKFFTAFPTIHLKNLSRFWFGENTAYRCQKPCQGYGL
jgi:hypothetical protein